jgi:raffinose/stachyose/melibiose transport system permease protein
MRLVGSADPRREHLGAGSAADHADRTAIARRRRIRNGIETGLFVSPALALYLLFVVGPLIYAAYFSLYHWSGLGAAIDFVGLHNYVLAFQDDLFRASILHNFTIAALSIVFQLPLGLGAALLLNRRFPGRAALRLVFFAPYVLSEAIVAIIWLLMLQPDGLVDHFFRAVGLGGLIHLWLADLHIVLYTMFVVITWKYIGFGIILFLAGLQGIPGEVLEAASIDGANELQAIRHVTIPLLGPTIRIWGFLSIIGSFQLFDLIWLTTLGGPSGASSTMATYLIDHGFRRYQFGYGSAASVILFMISLVIAVLYQGILLRRDTEGAVTRMVA